MIPPPVMPSRPTVTALRRGICAALPSLLLACATTPEPSARSSAGSVGATVDVRFSPRAIQRGGIAADPVALTLRKGDAREQQWWFAARPAGDGPLEVRVGVEGAAYERDDGEGLVFAAGSARVRYGHGLWIDARGIRVPVPARFDAERGEVVLSLSAADLAQSAYPAVLDPDIVLLNGTGLIDPRMGASAVYPAAGSAPSLAVAVTYDRGSSAVTSGVWSVSPMTATSTLLRPTESIDTVGLAMQWTGNPLFFSMRRVSSGAGLRFELVTLGGDPVLPNLGAAPIAPPWLACARTDPSMAPDGAGCAITYGLAMGEGTNAQQFISARGPMAVPTPTLRGVFGPLSVDGDQDVEFYLGRPLVAWSQRSGMTTDVLLRWLLRVGVPDGPTFSARNLGEGLRARVACNEPDRACAIVFRRGVDLWAVQFDPETERILRVERRPPMAGTEFGPHDVTATRAGFRVAILERRIGSGAQSLRIIESTRGTPMMDSLTEQSVTLPAGTYADLRLDTALANDVSIAAWVGGTTSGPKAWGAIIRPSEDAALTRDATTDAPSRGDANATSDASATSDAIATIDANATDDVSATSDATVTIDASATDDVTAAEDGSAPTDGGAAPPRFDASSDAPPTDGAVPQWPRYGGGACACRIDDRPVTSVDGRALLALVLFASVARRRRPSR
jgi:hypothetical protein